MNKVEFEAYMQRDGVYLLHEQLLLPAGGTWQPTKAIRVKKKSGIGERLIEMPTYRCQTKGATLVDCMLENWEPLAPFYGYPTRKDRDQRSRRLVASGFTQAIAGVRETVRLHPTGWLVVADICDAYGSVAHEVACRLLSRSFEDGFVSVARSLMKLPWQTKTEPVQRRNVGIPQGSIFSGYAMAFMLRALPDEVGPYIRIFIYVDDILMICESEAQAHEAYQSLVQFLSARQLTLKGSVKDAVYSPSTAVTYLQRGVRQ